MDVVPNSDCKRIHPNENNSSSTAVLETRLARMENEKRILEEQLARYNRTKAEAFNLKIELNKLQQIMEYMTRNYQECCTEVCQDLDAITLKYEKMLSTTDALQQSNKELHCSIRFKKSTKLTMVDKIKELETLKTREMKCHCKLKNEVYQKQTLLEELKRCHAELKKAVSCKTAEAMKSRCELADATVAVQNETEELSALCRRNEEAERTLAEMETEFRQQKEEIAKRRDADSEELARVVQRVDAARARLAEATDESAHRTAERELANRFVRQAREASAAEMDRSQAQLEDLVCERGQLTVQLSDLQHQLDVALCDQDRLMAELAESAWRQVNLTDEKKKLERQKSQQSSKMELTRCEYENEMTCMKEMTMTNNRNLTLLEYEVEKTKREIDSNDWTLWRMRRTLDKTNA